MNIGMLGTGIVGQTIGSRLVDLGHTVKMGSRTPNNERARAWARGFAPLVPQNLQVPLNWEPSWYYEFGGTHYFDNGWTVSAGYIFNENSIPDRYYNPLVSDLDRHFFSVGTGYRGKRVDFDVAYQFGFGPTRTVTGTTTTITPTCTRGYRPGCGIRTRMNTSP